MKKISIRIDELLLERVDDAARTARTSRSELSRLALREWLNGQRRHRRAVGDRAGYEKYPVRPDEFGGLIAAQAGTAQQSPVSGDKDA